MQTACCYSHVITACSFIRFCQWRPEGTLWRPAKFPGGFINCYSNKLSEIFPYGTWSKSITWLLFQKYERQRTLCISSSLYNAVWKGTAKNGQVGAATNQSSFSLLGICSFHISDARNLSQSREPTNCNQTDNPHFFPNIKADRHKLIQSLSITLSSLGSIKRCDFALLNPLLLSLTLSTVSWTLTHSST